MKKLLVSSVYYDNPESPHTNKEWFKLQKKFIKENTNNFDFHIYLNNVKDRKIYKDVKIIGETKKRFENGTLSHRYCIRAIFDYFRKNKNKYDCFLLLDSDCFPIRKGWLFDLRNIIREKGYKFASVVRYENGETYPHPSAMLIPNEFIDEDLFQWPDTINTEGSDNLLEGNKIKDTGSANSFWRHGFMIGHPLTRTNVINLHPIYAGIYGDMFYHHGLGSRVSLKTSGVVEPKTAYRSKSYWEHHGKQFYKDVTVLFDLIMKSPQKFISNLRGNTLLKADNFNSYFELSSTGLQTQLVIV